MINEFNLNLTRLQVFASSICNLDCKFCYLQNQHKSGAYALLNKKIQEAWIDGSYVENIKLVLESMNSPREILDCISFWGGEPLILANNLLKPIEQLLTYFYNLKTLFFSTNFIKIDDIPNIIKIIEKFNKPRNLVLQLSIDAPPGELQAKGHCVDWNKYYQNIDTLFSEIEKQCDITNTTLILLPHATLAWEDINKNFNTYEQINDYVSYFNNFFDYINNAAEKYHIKNNIILSRNYLVPSLANQTSFSIEDGIELKNKLKKLNYYQHKNNLNKEKYLSQDMVCDNETFIFTDNPSCSSNSFDGITLLPDGTICGCLSDYILNSQSYWNWVTNNPILRPLYRESLLKKRLYINPITASKKEMFDYNWYIFNNIKDNCSTAFHLTINLALEMAKSGQIDYVYLENTDLLLSNISQFSHDLKCKEETLAGTKTSHIMPVGSLRKYMNGVAKMIKEHQEIDERFWNEI